MAVLEHVAPRPQVHLVHAHGRVERLSAPALSEARSVTPGVAVESRDHGGRSGLLRLEPKGIGVALEREGRARAREDLELVARTLRHARQEELPDAIAGMEAHRMAPSVP